MDQTFTLLPLHLDPISKAVSSPLPHLAAPLATLTATHRILVPLEDQIPPPPLPTNPKRSAQIQKMRDQGNTSLRRSTAASAKEAIQLYTYGVDMALGRPAWEPAALVHDEAAALYANRAQAYMAVSMWPEGAADGATSVELKRGGNGKAWWRRGKCLAEMGRWEEASLWVKKGLEVEGNEGDLVGLNRDIDAHLAR